MALALAFAAALAHRICRSKVPNVEDEWCDTSCNGKVQNCIAEYCECDPSPNCKSLSPAVKNSWCNDNCVGYAKGDQLPNCPPTICSCPEAGEAASTETEADAQEQPQAPEAPGLGQAPAPTAVPAPAVQQAPAPTAGQAPPDSAPAQDAPPAQVPAIDPVPVTKGCAAMTSISSEQLRCVFPLLDADRASKMAAAATDKMGQLLGTTCAWAAFLGNAGVESMQLTITKEIKARHSRARLRLPSLSPGPQGPARQPR